MRKKKETELRVWPAIEVLAIKSQKESKKKRIDHSSPKGSNIETFLPGRKGGERPLDKKEGGWKKTVHIAGGGRWAFRIKSFRCRADIKRK